MSTMSADTRVSDEQIEAATNAIEKAVEEAMYQRHERGFLMKPLIDPIDVRALIRAALVPSPPPSAAPPSEGEAVGWLIEQKGGTPSWFQLVDGDNWTADSLKALRFGRKEDAQAYIDDIGWTEAFPSEHMWLDPRAAPPSDGVATAIDAGALEEASRNTCDSWDKLPDTMKQFLRDENTRVISAYIDALRDAPSPGPGTTFADALKAIAGGHDPRLSDMVLAGDWRGAFGVLQGLAKAALDLAPPVSGEGNTVYLAARYSRAPELRNYRAELQERGYVVTSRWLDGGHEIAKEGSTQAAHLERARFAAEDRADLMAASIVINFTEEPRKTTTRGGRHVEHGIALATGKRVLVVGHRENVFHCLPEVEFFDNWGEALAALPAPPVPGAS